MDDHRDKAAFALVIIGLLFVAFGCWYHLAELTTAAVGVTGVGSGMLKSSDGNTVKGSGSINVTPDAAS